MGRKITPKGKLMGQTQLQVSDTGVKSMTVLKQFTSPFLQGPKIPSLTNDLGQRYFRIGNSVIGGDDVVQ